MTVLPEITGGFGAILADPPWHWRARSSKGEGRSAKRHYNVMSLDEIAALPIGALAADDAALFLWAIDPMLPQALEVIDAWGFTFKTVAFTWAKSNAAGRFPIGCGYWTRSNPEMCLFATRGRPKRIARDVRQLVISPRRAHSQKPDEVRTSIERLVAGPYLEIFARERAPGWSSWGNELDHFNSESNPILACDDAPSESPPRTKFRKTRNHPT